VQLDITEETALQYMQNQLIVLGRRGFTVQRGSMWAVLDFQQVILLGPARAHGNEQVWSTDTLLFALRAILLRNEGI